MAEHTRSSITIEAAPAEVMAVISDFARYPEWTGEVKEAEILATDDQGRAERVRLVLDAGAIKDDHTLQYTWGGPGQVSWSLVKSQMLRTLDGSYTLVPVQGGKATVHFSESAPDAILVEGRTASGEWKQLGTTSVAKKVGTYDVALDPSIAFDQARLTMQGQWMKADEITFSGLTTLGLRRYYAASAGIPSPHDICGGVSTRCDAYTDLLRDAALQQLHAVFIGAAACAVIAAVVALVGLRPFRDPNDGNVSQLLA